MKKFMQTKLQELTVAQSFLYIVLYTVFFTIVWIAMFIVPQHAEEIWDWCAEKLEAIKSVLFRKKEKPAQEGIDQM